MSYIVFWAKSLLIFSLHYHYKRRSRKSTNFMTKTTRNKSAKWHCSCPTPIKKT